MLSVPIDIDKQFRDLRIDIQGSALYHLRRHNFFNRLSSTLILGAWTGLCFTLVFMHNGDIEKWAVSGFITLMLVALYLINTRSKADSHNELFRRFSALRREMEVSYIECTNAHITRWKNDRLEIEKDEPPIMRIVDALCYNEVALSNGSTDLYHVPILKRIIAHFSNWGADSIRKQAS